LDIKLRGGSNSTGIPWGHSCGETVDFFGWAVGVIQAVGSSCSFVSTPDENGSFVAGENGTLG
jgi:hypothetical protein